MAGTSKRRERITVAYYRSLNQAIEGATREGFKYLYTYYHYEGFAAWYASNRAKSQPPVWVNPDPSIYCE